VRQQNLSVTDNAADLAPAGDKRKLLADR